MVDEKKPKKGFFAARLPAFLQMTIGIGLLSVAYQHVSTTAYKFPTVNTLERRIAFSLRCLLVSVVPFIAALGSVGMSA